MQTERQKALIILTPGFPANEADSNCLPPQQIFVKALQQGHPDIKVIVLSFQYPFLKDDYLWNGIRIIAFGGKSKGKLYRLLLWLQVWRTLKKLNREYEVIGLLSFWLGECAFVAGWFAKIKGLKHYCWLLGQDAKAGNKYAAWLRPAGDKLIALSDFLAKEYNKNYGVLPSHIIPVGIDASLFSKVKTERNIDILGAGSLIPLKQYDVFIKIISLLKRLYPNIKTVICGNGPEMEPFSAIINVLGLQDNVILKGELPHPEVLALMQRSKILLHPSVYEGFGAVCAEALYAGATVVSFVKPMDKPVLKWNIAVNEQNMVQKIRAILDDLDPDYTPVMLYPIADNVRTMMQLFDYKEHATC